MTQRGRGLGGGQLWVSPTYKDARQRIFAMLASIIFVMLGYLDC